jgi:hypothetical protein
MPRTKTRNNLPDLVEETSQEEISLVATFQVAHIDQKPIKLSLQI